MTIATKLHNLDNVDLIHFHDALEVAKGAEQNDPNLTLISSKSLQDLEARVDLEINNRVKQGTLVV